MRPSLLSFRQFQPVQEVNLLQDMLELVQEPALLLDPSQKRILAANGKAAALTAYSISELLEMHLERIFPKLPQIQNPNSTGQYDEELDLVMRNGNRLQVLINFHSLRLPSRPALVLKIKPVQQIHQEQLTKKIRDEILALMQTTTQELMNQPPAVFLTNALQHWAEALGTEICAIYMLSEGAPYLIRKDSFPEDAKLPDQLSGSDLTILNTPYLWQPGKRKMTTLHHELIRRKHTAFIFTHPLGDAYAPIGLLCLASETSQPAADLHKIAAILAGLITSAIQNETLAINLKHRNSELETHLTLDQKILAEMSEAILILTPEMHVWYANSFAEDMLGYTANELVNLPVEDILIGPNHVKSILENMDTIRERTDLKDITLFRRSGKPFYANISVVPVISHDKIENIILIMQDQSEQEALRAQTTRLERQAEVGFLISVFAHEVGNPLQNILSNLEDAADNLEANHPSAPKLEIAKRNVDAINNLMKTTLDISRPFELQLKKMDVNQLLRSMMSSFYPRLEKNSIDGRLRELPTPSYINGNYRALQQVFTNLITNAINAMGENGGILGVVIQDYTESNGDQFVEVSISDTGRGIPEEILQEIFKPGFTTSPKGNGLGLSISRQIIVRHKGTVSVESFPGGTVFHVRIPKFIQQGEN